jgi:PEP-CTERM motif
MKSFVHQVVAPVALALFGVSSAHAQSLVNLQVDVSDLKIDSVSLLDGASPSSYTVSLFKEPGLTGVTAAATGLQSIILRSTDYRTTFSDQVSVTSALLPTQTVMRSIADGSSLTSITPTSISLGTTLTEQALDALASTDGPPVGQRYFSSVSFGRNADLSIGVPVNSNSNSNSNSNGNAWRVTLAPQSQLTLSGVVTTAFSMDVEGVSRLLSPLAQTQALYTLFFSAGANFSAAVIDPDEGGFVIAPANPLLFVQYFFDTDGAYQLKDRQSGPVVRKQNSLTLTLVNDQDVEKSFQVGFLSVNDLFTVVSGRGSSENGFELVRDIPEPSTYALMGLGLVGLSVVARQRRAKQAH